MDKNFFTLDVFTTTKLAGNPLAVVTDSDGLNDKQMQQIASEFNLPETVFILPASTKGTDARLRIFTPKRELPFAGHPTIGTAILLAALRAQNNNFEGEIILEEQAGLIPVKIKYSNGTGEAEFISPGEPEKAEKVERQDIIAQALGLQPEDIGFDNHTPSFAKASGNGWLFVPVKSLEVISNAKVNSAYWSAARAGYEVIGVYLYTKDCKNEESSYHARMFAPDYGITEDPATGSAAATFPGCLMLFENLADGGHTWILEQGYEMGRPSRIVVSADILNSLITRVRIAGHAVLFIKGSMNI